MLAVENLWDVAICSGFSEEKSRFAGNGYGQFALKKEKKKKKLARGPAAGTGLVGKLIIMVGRLTREILWF